MSSMTSFTSACFEASHRGDYADEVHGHLWWAEIGWPSEPRVDARIMHKQLTACLDQWDHKMLDGLVEPTNEGVAQAISEQIVGLSSVRVWREGRVPCGAYWINNEMKGGQPQRPALREGEMDRSRMGEVS